MGLLDVIASLVRWPVSLLIHSFLFKWLMAPLILASSLAAGAYVFWYYRLRAKPDFSVVGKHVVITGASSGLGLELAKRAAREGAHVSLIARNPTKLMEARRQVWDQRRDGKRMVHAEPCDVGNNASIAEGIRRVIDTNGVPDVVVPCAGSSRPGFLANMTMEEIEMQMNVNYMGTVRVIKACLPGMAARGTGGHVVIVSSALAVCSMLGYGAYSPTKYALKGLADTLYTELGLYNIKLLHYLPGSMDSPGFEEENKIKPEITAKLEEGSPAIPPAQAADDLWATLERGDAWGTPDFLTRLMMHSSQSTSPRNNGLFDVVVSPFVTLALWYTSAIEFPSKIRAWRAKGGSIDQPHSKAD